MTFSFFPILEIPETEEGVARLVNTFARAAAQGLEVYEETREKLTEKFLEKTLRTGGEFTRLSFHDTMNTTTSTDGAVNVAREEKDRLPAVVALSNRGDENGETRDENDPATMDPSALRALAAAHRTAFEVSDPHAVQLNKPYLGSQEIIAAGNLFRSLGEKAARSGARLHAVQAEFLREFLLGDDATDELHRPGTDWITEDPNRVDELAHACKSAWDNFREW